MESANKLLQGDSSERLKCIPDESIDLTVTSPPYDDLRQYNGNNALWCEGVWKLVIEGLYRVTKRGGVVVWVVGDATKKGSETGTSFRQALFAMECGFNLHDTMIWDKGAFSAVGSLAIRYAPVFEYMFVFSKGKPKTFNPIKDRKNKHAGSVLHGTVKDDNGVSRPCVGAGVKTIAEYGQRYNVWRMPAEKSNSKRFHPAQFPEHLVRDHVISWSNEGDTVLDPFMGSGTTGVVCKQMGRKFIGIEMDPEYLMTAESRISEVMV